MMKPLMGVGGSFLKEDQSRHVWILSTGELHHLGDQNMSIYGSRSVDSHVLDLSSLGGELQSQKSITILAEAVLQANMAMGMPITL